VVVGTRWRVHTDRCTCPALTLSVVPGHRSWGHPRFALCASVDGHVPPLPLPLPSPPSTAGVAGSTAVAALHTSSPPPSPVRAMVAAAFAAAALAFGSPRAATAAGAVPSHARDANAGSDVSAATATLLAVTGAAVVLRVVSARREDPEAEAARVAAECERLAREEKSRAIRTQRLEMELLDDEEDEEEDGAVGVGERGSGGGDGGGDGGAPPDQERLDMLKRMFDAPSGGDGKKRS